ncbi:alanyl-tRNA editing protein [Yokenella regensburgei]|uniref:alanyl-tRNA editing protein n=1 Tax=Yokenella regensburgei TaxID=158877 RepID=UPI003F159C59
MTQRDYYTCDETDGEANVLRCVSAEDGGFNVELDATLFHPQGGGQPADKGWINEVAVLGVFNEGDSVWHRTSAPIEPGRVSVRVDRELRRLHSRWHSAGHLIGYAGEMHQLQPVKAHHWPGEGRITFTGASALPDGAALEALITGWVAENLPLNVAFVDGKRQVRFGELPAYGCGGTHMPATGEIGLITLTTIKLKKGQLIVSYSVD